MKLHNILNKIQRVGLPSTTFSSRKSGAGFTLIEIVIVIGIFLLIVSVSLFMSMDIFRGTSRGSERDVIISLIEKARGQAMNNLNRTSHGFCYDAVALTYTVFQGDSCATATVIESFPAGGPFTITEISPAPAILPKGIIFSQLSGTSTWSGTMTLTQAGKTVNISINDEGMIDWSI
jgi:type II secretory pathway pseudopilin PulG